MRPLLKLLRASYETTHRKQASTRDCVMAYVLILKKVAMGAWWEETQVYTSSSTTLLRSDNIDMIEGEPSSKQKLY